MGDDESTWTRWRDELDWRKILVASTASWSIPRTSPLAAPLPPAEWNRFGAEGRPVVFVGTDATQWSWCSINWTLKERVHEGVHDRASQSRHV